MGIKIYGASDDLLEIEGDIEEEFNVNCREDIYLGVSDGTLFHINYDDNGIWRINLLRAGSAGYLRVDGDYIKDTNDVVTMNGKVEWVVVGTMRALKIRKNERNH